MKVVIAGGSGFLGRALESQLVAQRHTCVVLTRSPRESNDIQWDGKTVGDWCRALEGATAVVNLTGRSVNCLYNEANRREIVESRVNSVRAIRSAILACKAPPKVLVQASSLAIYGYTYTPTDESAPHGSGFSVSVCEAWEASSADQVLSGVRTCILRIGLVLGPNGGVLMPFRKLTKLFLGGTVGTGRQYLSWIHMNDFLRIVMTCIQNDALSGAMNVTGPDPVTNRDFMRTMRKVLRRPWSPSVPSWCVRFGARYLMKTEPELALNGMRCLPSRLQRVGFEFEYVDLETALQDVMSRWESA